MRIIDLLNKIANGEEVPSPIYHKSIYYDFDDGDYFNQKTTHWLFNDNDIESILNDEVEIIEEDKKIEKLPYYDYKETMSENNRDKFIEKLLEKHDKRLNDYHEKINEIIDYLEEKDNE